MAARTTAVVSFAILFIFGMGCSWRGAVANGGSWGCCVDNGSSCGVVLKLSIGFFGALAGARFFFGFRRRLLGIGKQLVDTDHVGRSPETIGSACRNTATPDCCSGSYRSCVHEHADAPHPLALLRARRERPSRRAPDERDELAPPHSITSSASANIFAGKSPAMGMHMARATLASRSCARWQGRSPKAAPSGTSSAGVGRNHGAG